MSDSPSDYLFVTRSLRPVGGEEALAARCLQCLLRRGSVTVVTYTEPDLVGLDRMAGTALAAASLDIIPSRSPALELLSRLGMPTRLLSFRLFLRRVRARRRRGQPCISVGGDVDLGDSEDVCQYLATSPRYHSKTLRAQNLGGASGLAHKVMALLNLALCDLLVPCRDARTGRYFTAAVSEWVGKQFERLYGRPADLILHPPPLGTSSAPVRKTIWGFVSLCRAHPGKAWLEMIAVVKGLRQRGHAVCFTMLALDRGDSFTEVLRTESARNADWLKLEVSAPRARLDQALGDHHFGLHLARDEGYGMAVAEMLLAGCLTGVSDSGGQREIVTEPELRFSSADDAVEKWDLILSNPDLCQCLRDRQQARRELYTRALFEAGFHQAIDRLEGGTISPGR
jgi:hypothetical protein